MRTKISILWVRLTKWEYWPWYIVYIPVFIYWLWSGLRSRAIFWISAANPGFEYGGIIGASKKKILDKIPKKYVPKTLLIEHDTELPEILNRLEISELSFPLIVKPDIGERGFHVTLVVDKAELKNYLKDKDEDHLIQEYLDMPIELGVFYYRMPNETTGRVSSIVMKQLLKVTGNGESSIVELMGQDSRAAQQVARLRDAGKIDLDRIPALNEIILLEPIGNHVRGTTFLSANHLINAGLTQVFDTLSKQIIGFYYGRYDIRCESLDALYQGEFKIMELNGSASEPAHIYSPGYPILKGYRELLFHWKVLYKICRINNRSGIEYMPFKVGWAALRKSRFTRKKS